MTTTSTWKLRFAQNVICVAREWTRRFSLVYPSFEASISLKQRQIYELSTASPVLIDVQKGRTMFGPKTKKSERAIETSPASARITPAVEQSPVIEPKGPAVIPSQNVIGKGTIIQGNIVAEGDLLIEGTVRGDVTTKTRLIVGPTCVVEGNIIADYAEVAGRVKGTVQALGLLIIKSSSMIDGDVLTKNLNVESGSTFNGRFTVGSVTSTNNAASPKNEPSAIKADASVLAGDVRRPSSAVPSAPSKV